MEVTEFYLCLPSNNSLDKLPQNTLTEYRAGLPQTITLEGEWEAETLTEIDYPHSWNNVQNNFVNRVPLCNQDLHGVWVAILKRGGVKERSFQRPCEIFI